ncbi:CMRF35-like molecule 8 [Rhinichthys klamathensis goyatoka]|uniref:CMRF35-like molecule 8 n=1 Tax=Rhinichthys klamathensis goyatoka TaxID=3034132 RepID=UPI0024B60A7A|nr:CMRF35-like molecule 8 [Rhinichthys klamathensis goyatoka]
MMLDVLLLFSRICTAVVGGASQTITGYIGERVDIRCSYDYGYESNSKYFCKGECIYGNRIIMVKSGSPAKDERFSLTDDTTARVFTVTITDLRTEDEGQYWCAVKRSITDVYSEILLLVMLGSFVIIIITAEALVLLLIAVPLIIVAVQMRKKNKGLLSSATVVFNPVIYDQIKDTGRFCNPEDRDTETTVFYSCVS